MSIRINY